MAELKKCPFCGGEVIETYTETVDAETEVYHFRCRSCYSDTYFDYSDEKQSIIDWNNRVTEADIRAKAIDEFAEKLKEEFHGEHWTKFCTIRNKVDEISEQLKEE